MVQVLPLTQRVVEAAEAFEERFLEAAADGEITTDEVAFLTPVVRLVVVSSQQADLARAAGMAVIKGGIGAKRAMDLLHQIDASQDPFEFEAA
jgi:hypothetical protein